MSKTYGEVIAERTVHLMEYDLTKLTAKEKVSYLRAVNISIFTKLGVDLNWDDPTNQTHYDFEGGKK